MSDIDAPTGRTDEALIAASPRAFRRRLAWWIVSLATIAIAVAFAISRMPETSGLALDWRRTLPLGAYAVLMQVAMAVALRVLTGSRLAFADALGLMFASGFLNLVAPARLGAVYRTAASVRLARMTVGEAIGVQAALAIVALASGGCVALVALAVARRTFDGSLALVIASLPLAAALPLLLAARYRVRHGDGSPQDSRLKRWMAALAQGLAAGPQRLAGAFLATAIANSCAALMVRESYLATGTDLDVATSLVLLPVALLSNLVAIAPGGIGTREALMVLAGAALGLRPEAAATAALVERVVASTAVLACGGSALLWLNRRRLR